jgi:predicted transcriptional regulator
MRVREILAKKPPRVVTVESHAELNTAVRLMMQHEIGGLPVVAHGTTPIGFVAERDVVDALDRYDGPIGHLRVENVMRPLPECSPDDALSEVMARMTRQRLRHLVVLEQHRLVGVISVGDLVRHRMEQLEIEAGVLRDYVAAHRAARLQVPRR